MDNVIRLLESFYCTPWAISDKHLKYFENQLWQAYKTGSTEFLENAKSKSSKVSTLGNMAIVPIQGPIGHRASFMSDYFGWPTTERLKESVQQHADDPSISAIVLDINSPGGDATGNEELHQEILKTREKKPVIAIANGMAASAAYYIASAANEIIVTPSGSVGSVGTVMVHADMSTMYESAGITVTVIKAGKYKWEGNSYEPLNDEARSALQQRVDDHYQMFVNAVAKGRNVSAATVKNDFGQGRMLMAKDALKVGMVDRIGTMEDVIGKLGSRRQSGGMRMEGVQSSEIEVLKLKNSLLAL